MSPTLQVRDTLLTAAQQKITLAAEHLLSLQHSDGYWCALLTADTTLESDYILLRLWMHAPVDGVWDPPNRGQIDRAAMRILSKQLPDGGFNIYVKGPSEISACVKAYFALKLAGVPVDGDQMTRLRDCILAPGCSVGDGTHISGGAVLGEGVSVGARNVITRGARIFPGVQLPDGAIEF